MAIDITQRTEPPAGAHDGAQEWGPDLKVSDLWEFAVGGSEVAARPNGPANVIQGPRPAGVEEAAHWMASAIADQRLGQRMLFLVGGPGGGKSHVAAELVTDLSRVDDQNGDLAHRCYRFSTPAARELLLVNDATIPAADGGVGTLAAEVESAGDRHLIACVNRGVLVDELVREPEGIGALITNWLRSGKGGECAEAKLELREHNQDYLRQAVLHWLDGHVIEATAVFVDTCSLFEKRPRVSELDGDLFAGAYGIELFTPGLDRSETPAGLFSESVLQSIGHSRAVQHDPVAANLESLASQDVRNGVLSILRAAELTSSQRFSYRQLWGAFARIVAGNLPEQLNTDGLGGWLDALSPDRTDSPRSRFEAFKQLAGVRTHMALFGGADAVGPKHPVLDLTRAVDPARDLRPGDGEGQGRGWANPVFQAFTGAGLGASPLEGLRGSAASSALDQYITPFDQDLDTAFRDALEAVEDIAWRTDAIAWYGLYLSRMLGVATGQPAFGDELTVWTEAWRMSQTVPYRLEAQLGDLVAPPRNPGKADGISQIPVFTSRAMAIVGAPPSPTLAVQIPKPKFFTRRDGEDLFLEVYHENKKVGEMRLDLPLIREALVSGEGWLGLTDATESTIPRLERFRATTALPLGREANFIRLVTQLDDYSVAIQES